MRLMTGRRRLRGGVMLELNLARSIDLDNMMWGCGIALYSV